MALLKSRYTPPVMNFSYNRFVLMMDSKKWFTCANGSYASNEYTICTAALQVFT